MDRVSTPDFATSVGLILYGYNQWKDKGISKDRKKGFWIKMKEWLREA